MQYRKLGNTGEVVSIVGVGGMALAKLSQSEADSLVAEAIDRGVNYFDVAPTYDNAEELLGPALDGKRDKAFLACKTTMRTAREAEFELNRTLSRLRTDHVDLYQMHGLDDPNELATAMGPDGALQVFKAAKAAGKVKHIGITGHSVENLLNAIGTGEFETVLFPVNFAQFEMADYGPKLLSKAVSLGLGRIAIKAAAKERWAKDEVHTSPNCWYKPVSEERLFKLAIRYTLSQDVTVAMPPGDTRLVRMAMDVAEDFHPISEDELKELRESSREFTPLFPLKTS